MRIHVVEGMKLSQEQKQRLEGLGEIKYFDGIPSAEEVVERSKGADIICADWSPLDKAILKMPEEVKLVSVSFTGVDFLPLKEAAEKGVKVANAPGYATESVAEFGVGLMLALVRRIYLYARGEAEPSPAKSLRGKTLCIVGAGRIGSEVGRISKALGMNVDYFKRGDDLHSKLRQADVVYCALPPTKETQSILGEEEFKQMKKGSYFVTTSWHTIYDHNALLKALEDNLAGAALDLEGITCGDYQNEVYQKFKGHSRILITPHVAFKTDFAVSCGYDIMIDNIEAFLKGRPQNIVN